MALIHVLPPELASQIAAGEVVERPASAVKELVENSLDAGASRIDVAIEGGGITLVSVADDGAGMTEEDARLSVERHATSKLDAFADLGRIRSFGFRGEALPSIASVSRFTLRTRTSGCESGVELVMEAAGRPSVRPAGMPVGTVVELRDLFFNVPARRKFLRSAGTESGHVAHVIEMIALARPEVTFRLSRDGRLVRELLRTSGRRERIHQVVDDEPLAACRGERGPLKLEAFLSRPERARSGAGGLELLVNDRPVRDRALLLTVAQSYGSVLERGRYPRGVVYLDLPPELVDVNVHPQKAEVRFADARAVTDATYGILSRALAGAFSLPTPARSAWNRSQSQPSPNARSVVDLQPSSITDAPPIAAEGSQPDPWGLAPPGSVVDAVTDSEAQSDSAEPVASALAELGAVPSVAPSIPAAESGSNGSEPRGQAVAPGGSTIFVRDSAKAPIRPRPEVWWSSLKFVAQLRQTFLFCEGPDGFYVLDQHAAAERVTFTRLRRAYQARAVPSQALLFPVTFEVAPAEAALIEEYSAQIAEVGLDVRIRGERLASVHAVPRLLQRTSAERLVRDLINEISRSGGRGFSQAVDLALATMACHGSIRAGDPLSATEATALLNALDGADFAGHCPHGRPVVTFTSWAELERKVGRR